MLAHRFLFALKARQLGLTTLACAYDVWHLRFGPPNATVHLFSKGEADALTWPPTQKVSSPSVM